MKTFVTHIYAISPISGEILTLNHYPMKYTLKSIFILLTTVFLSITSLLIYSHHTPTPKIGQVYTWNNDNPFTIKESYKDSVTNIKGAYIQFDEYLNDTIVYTNASCTISEFLKENKLLK